MKPWKDASNPGWKPPVRVRFAKRRPEAEAAVEKILGVKGIFEGESSLSTNDMFATRELPERLRQAAVKIFMERLIEPAAEIEIIRKALFEVDKE